MSKPPSKSVFVGNIPYGLTEEQIIRIFSSAGKVLNFRLVYDRETGKPKGFGFVEFPDSDSAASAVRNLNDYEIMNRKLRVDFSNDGGEEETQPAPTSYRPPPPSNGVSSSLPPINPNSSIPPLPAGADLPAGLTCPDAISRTLNTLPAEQLLDVLSQMKTLATTDAAKATELLHQAPQLSYAIFQALLLMGLVSTEALSSVVEQASAPPPLLTPQQQQAYQAPTPSNYPPGYPPPPPHMSGQMGIQMGTPPVQNQGLYPPPPQQRAPPPQQQAPQQNLADTDALMQQVLAMPQEVIDSLPPADRAQLLALRASFGR
ncbi:uncharacterized protein LY89DRAFT_643085 [Mollisia scopiformis]|uniref:RRM domain-containing protein n=1 Tax=Mollisia scopiformis TaxID=149040 RepID=A0A194XEV9_MOLSC|nr:uncharacterized protein LY89DRAFT_643085 [Mollisia scopiformis]KUJ18674.1 hypothetical protein LY89DRAFT_643085 [Mollisia scopiformis]